MIYHLFANRSNIGDWLAARGIQRLLRKEAGREIAVAEQLLDEPFVDETMAALEGMDDSDFVIIGGGGLVMDYFEPFWRRFEPFSRRVRFALWGIGACDLKSGHSLPDLDLLRDIAARAELCCVRDELTASMLAPVPCSVAPCPALATEFEAGDASLLLHVNNYTTAGEKAYRAMRRAGMKQARALGLAFREINNRIEPDRESEMQSLVSLYADAALVLSSGLHGCILAVAAGAPLIAVSGDRKIDEFIRAAGLEAHLCDISEMARMRTLLASPSAGDTSAFLRDAIELNRTVARGVLSRIGQNEAVPA